MWPLLGERKGSHYFDNTPNLLDQVLVSRGLIHPDASVSVVGGSARIESFPEMTSDGQYPAPIRFSRPSASSFNPDGFSDHFPISVGLVEA